LPRLGIGVSLSLVTGTERGSHVFERTVDGIVEEPLNHSFERTTERSYQGYDIRAGLLFCPHPLLSIGARLTVPQALHFTEHVTSSYPNVSTLGKQSYEREGILVSSYTGAVGLSIRLPIVTVVAEGRVRAPFSLVYPNEDIPDGGTARDFPAGVGAGVEVPLVFVPVVVRIGYAWDQLGQYVYVERYGDQPLTWSGDILEPARHLHRLGAGLACVIGSVRITTAYEMRSWEFVRDDALTLEHSLHRVAVSMAVRY
jgi:hypothetical protein